MITRGFAKRQALAVGVMCSIGFGYGISGALSAVSHPRPQLYGFGVTKVEYGNSSCKPDPPASGKGPVNVIFHGVGLTAQSIADDVARVDRAHWYLRTAVGSDSWVYDTNAGVCVRQNIQERLGFIKKHHIRFFGLSLPDASESYVAGDPHIDRKNVHGRCGKTVIGDAVPAHLGYGSGYDVGAQEIELSYGGLGSSRVSYLYVPDHAVFIQCNNAHAHWNGVVYLIRFP